MPKQKTTTEMEDILAELKYSFVTITREYSWEMGHALMNHKGKCYNIHGHNYRMEVEIRGDINPNTGMVMDFSQVDDIIESVIIKYDHKLFMNKKDPRMKLVQEAYPFEGEPTAENLAWVLFYKTDLAIDDEYANDTPRLERVTLYETDKASATVLRS
tara:strand:- start:3504 stop:3977 length:474 start_codon:yes stop_codon:yes gene_type:complete